MKKIMLFSLAAFVLVFSFSSVFAASCVNYNSKTTNDFMNEIPSINSQLSNCTANIPQALQSLVGSGNILVSISMTSGTTQQFYFSIANNAINSINSGLPSSYTYEVKMSESIFDSLLTSNDKMNDLLKGINNKDITIKANTFFGRIKWFFAKFFIPKPQTNTNTNTNQNTNNNVAGPTGKPEYCDETYLPGHRGYAENKELWDSYTSDTDKVCQSQYGRGIPSPCIHSVQLSVDGNPYYLCWYNE